jgi:hypothetical protein
MKIEVAGKIMLTSDSSELGKRNLQKTLFIFNYKIWNVSRRSLGSAYLP